MKYTKEIARTTKDPKILAYILKKGKNDLVSLLAAENPNCSPEILSEMSSSMSDQMIARATKDPQILIDILRRGNDDFISCYAAENPNCPIEMLVEILKRGNNDSVSRCAVTNPNCPPEILAEILKRGNDDWVTEYAAENPNCPIEARINWMMETGKIGKEAPGKHIIEYENIKEDDLSDLKDLLKNS